MGVEVNQAAPDFVLPGTDGTALQLSSLRGRKVVLFFYPRNNTRGCTAEACAFRDAYEELATAGAEVVGISSDSVESHRRFAASPGPSVPDRERPGRLGAALVRGELGSAARFDRPGYVPHR